jgi:serine/threonine protein kinase
MYNFLWLLSLFLLQSKFGRCFVGTRESTQYHRRCVSRGVTFDAGDIEVTRLLGKIDVALNDKLVEDTKRELLRTEDKDSYEALNSWVNKFQKLASQTTLVRIFEAKLVKNGYENKRVFLKEYLPIGLYFGRRELSTSKYLTDRFNEYQQQGGLSYVKNDSELLVPKLLGSLKTDERIENLEFRARWSNKFQRSKPPEKGCLWLIFDWDEASFKSFKYFAPLPQVVEGFDYFRPTERLNKRWNFIRKIFKKTLESLDFLHRNSLCHNAISGDSIWLSTTNQIEIEKLYVKITDLGSTQKFSEYRSSLSDARSSDARNAALEDLYQLGFVFLELIINSFCDDNIGARKIRAKLAGKEYKIDYLARAEDIDQSQLRQKEYQQMFEGLCEYDIGMLRETVRNIKEWREAFEVLELNNGAAWKLIFTLLAAPTLYDNDLNKPLKVTCATILNDFKTTLFAQEN